MALWLMKSEPDTFGYPDLVKAERAGWDGVRSLQARTFLRAMQVGDLAIFYHSSTNPPGAAGICTIVGTAEPDPTQFDPAGHYYDPTSDPAKPKWDWVTVAPVRALRRYVPLAELRTLPELAGSRLVAKANRLSVIPFSQDEFDAVVRASERD